MRCGCTALRNSNALVGSEVLLSGFVSRSLPEREESGRGIQQCFHEHLFRTRRLFSRSPTSMSCQLRSSRCLLLAMVCAPSVALAFNSRCALSDGGSCASGPQTAQNRWRGEGDEHRQLWVSTATMAGLPGPLLQDVSVTVFTSEALVQAGGDSFDSIRPVPFERTMRSHKRTWRIRCTEWWLRAATD